MIKTISSTFYSTSSDSKHRLCLHLGSVILCIIALNLGSCGCKFRGSQEDLRAAIQGGDVEEIKKLLAEGGMDVNKKDFLGHTLLKEAIESGNKEVVQILLEKGADPNATSGYWGTPLEHLTQGHGTVDTEIVKLLLKHGAKVNIKDKDGDTLLDRAMKHKQPEVVKLLLETAGVIFNKKKVISWALDQGDVGIVKTLLDKKIINKANVNKKDLFGNTLLNEAISKDDKKMVKLLLEADGIKVNQQRDIYHDTPLIQAVMQGKPEIVEMLLGKKGIKVGKAHPIDGNTPLHIAVEGGNKRIIKLLLEHGAKLTTKNNEGSIPAQMTNSQGLRDFLLNPVGKDFT